MKIEIITPRKRPHHDATYENSIEAIKNLKNEFGGSYLFGVEKAIQSIAASGRSIRLKTEKAAMLKYQTVKNHSFVDGNKRIARIPDTCSSVCANCCDERCSLRYHRHLWKGRRAQL